MTKVAAMAIMALSLASTAPRGGFADESPRETHPADPLPLLGLEETTGAAPGYLDDRACRSCHGSIWTMFQKGGMARSFSRPDPADVVETLGVDFFHEPSRERYRMTWQDGALRFRRWQLDDQGDEINVFERDVDWTLGSGLRSRVYLYRTPAGELFQLPLAWYTEEGAWGMAPGFDRPDHLGLAREVRRECMFCHNAYPEVAAGSDWRWQPDLYPVELPQGIGCQRCHGPGGLHVRAVLAGQSGPDVRRAIVNPAHLPREEREGVCFQCHLQPSVALPRVRRFDRGDYSFRPGEPLSWYLIAADAIDADRRPEERFEINHAAYRLQQTPCYRAGLTCTDCHDPHQPLTGDPRLAAVEAICGRCHSAHPPSNGAPQPLESGCVGCHMPRRRTQDVVHVLMTDHRLVRRPPANPLAPLREHDPAIVAVGLAEDSPVSGATREVVLAITALRANPGSAAALSQLLEGLEEAAPASPLPFLELAAGLLSQRRFQDAITLLAGDGPEPWRPLLASWQGTALAGLGDLGAAAVLHRQAAATTDLPEDHFNLGVVLLASGHVDEAVHHLTLALERRSTFARAWLRRGDARAIRQGAAAAIPDYLRALAVDPRLHAGYVALAAALETTGDDSGAERWRRHGETIAARLSAD